MVQVLLSLHAVLVVPLQQSGLSVSAPCTHLLFSHWSTVHGSLSLHWLASQHTPAMGAWTHLPRFVSQLSAVHALPSSQLTFGVPEHLPLAHTSPVVQALPSSHGRILNTFWHAPVVWLHESLVHRMPSLQFLAAPGWHAPFAQLSPCVHGLPSVQNRTQVPFAHAVKGSWQSVAMAHGGGGVGRTGATLWQPFAASQLSTMHGLPVPQVIAVPTHAPLWHLSPTVQTLLSSQGKLLLAWPQVPPLQLSVVQRLPSSHGMGVPAHAELAQRSLIVHGLPSLHALVLATYWQPLTGSQESVVHGLASLHVSVPPARHVPALQASLGVQTELSALQLKPLFCATRLQTPLVGLQVFLAQNVSLTVLQVMIVEGLTLQLYGRLPRSQKSVPLQRLPSSWPAQSASLVQVHVLVPETQTLLAQLSPVVHVLPSSQAPAAGACVQPAFTSQLSVVHTLLSSQNTVAVTAEPRQTPPAQVSLTVQAFASLQAIVFGA